MDSAVPDVTPERNHASKTNLSRLVFRAERVASTSASWLGSSKRVRSASIAFSEKSQKSRSGVLAAGRVIAALILEPEMYSYPRTSATRCACAVLPDPVRSDTIMFTALDRGLVLAIRID